MILLAVASANAFPRRVTDEGRRPSRSHLVDQLKVRAPSAFVNALGCGAVVSPTNPLSVAFAVFAAMGIGIVRTPVQAPRATRSPNVSSAASAANSSTGS